MATMSLVSNDKFQRHLFGHRYENSKLYHTFFLKLSILLYKTEEGFVNTALGL